MPDDVEDLDAERSRSLDPQEQRRDVVLVGLLQSRVLFGFDFVQLSPSSVSEGHGAQEVRIPTEQDPKPHHAIQL